MPLEVLEAMSEAARASVDMAELHAKASAVIAECTGAEGGLVTSGAAAALTLGTAACLAALDVARMERLPCTDGIPNEVIMCRTHRTGYDHAIRAAGASIRDVGFNDRGVGAGVRAVEAWEIEVAITPQTVAIAYTATPANQPPLSDLAKLAARYRVPLIVDAAAQLPPRENLRRFVAEGASLVAFSGGKAIRGPQSTGILCGRRDLIASAALQMLDMDVAPETWAPPESFIPWQDLHGIPHHGLGRGFKVGKEEIAGLIVALQRYVRMDPEAENVAWERQLARIAEALTDAPHVSIRILPASETGRVPLLELTLKESTLGRTAWDVSRELQRGDTPLHLHERRASEGILTVNPAALQDGDVEIIIARLKIILRS
jgi:D-glucosaminate-6-phosphate ammonia-lyase